MKIQSTPGSSVVAAIAFIAVAAAAPTAASAQERFLRGDANVDGKVDISDGYVVLNALFLGTSEILCEDAADSDDNGTVDVADSINTLNYLFRGTGHIPAPFPEPGLDTTTDSLSCLVSFEGTPPRPLVAVNDADALTGFTFERVIQKLIDTSPNNASPSLQTFYHFWWRQVGSACSATINGFPNACGRAEAALEDNDPFADPGTNPDGYVPVAVFNRFDLARGGDCGEYRVVFGKRSGITQLFDRNMIIFEARVPSPNGTLAGCRPLQEAWAALETMTVAQQGAALEAMFFDGIAGMNALIHGDHFKPSTGQVRTNTRMASAEPWALREWKLNTACGGAVCVTYLAQRATDRSPAAELYGTSHPLASIFQTWFSTTGVDQLVADPDSFSPPAGYRDAVSLTNDTDDPRIHALPNAFLTQRIEARLDSLGSNLTAGQVLSRATSQSCAGCHQLTVLDDLGAGQLGPASLGAQHVNERGALSHTLREDFLPARVATVEAFLGN